MASVSPSQPRGANESVGSNTSYAPVSNVRRAFREFNSALMLVSKQAGDITASGACAISTKEVSDNNTVIKGPLDEVAAVIVKRKQSLRSNAAILEAVLRGNVKESEALQCCLRSQPCVGGRKRFFHLMNDHD